jgi:hypothetical protein
MQNDKIGWVQKMKMNVGSRWEIFRYLIDLLNKPSNIVMVLMNCFSMYRGHTKFKYDVIDNKWIDIDSIITLVTMTYNKV